MIFYLVLCIICLYFPLIAYVQGQWCFTAPLSPWLLVQACFYLAFMVKAGILVLMTYMQAPETPRLVRFKLAVDIVFTFLINVLQVVWFIFGNTFLYSEGA
jgi:hypothetical protein